MRNRLILNIDKAIIKQAKAYAKKHVSLSGLIENYLNSLTRNPAKAEVSPLVVSLTGVMEPLGDYKKGYTDYLSEKYT